MPGQPYLPQSMLVDDYGNAYSRAYVTYWTISVVETLELHVFFQTGKALYMLCMICYASSPVIIPTNKRNGQVTSFVSYYQSPLEAKCGR